LGKEGNKASKGTNTFLAMPAETVEYKRGRDGKEIKTSAYEKGQQRRDRNWVDQRRCSSGDYGFRSRLTRSERNAPSLGPPKAMKKGRGLEGRGLMQSPRGPLLLKQLAKGRMVGPIRGAMVRSQ